MSYSWGDDSGSKRVDGEGYDFKSARDAYKDSTPIASSASRGMRSSLGGSSERVRDYRSRIGKTAAPVGKDVVTTSTHPIVVACDVTGSMAHWPGIIFEKLPLLGKEIEHYAPDYAISFTAFGDAYCDSHPLQVRDFDVGEKLDEHIAGLYPEGGGGDIPENPDIVAYYYLNHCKMDKAVKPFFFIITDVRSHSTLTSDAIKKLTGDDIQGSGLNSAELLKKLSDKFNVFVLLKGREAKTYWEEIYGAQKVKVIDEPRDIVELIIACIADEMGEIKDFEMRSSKRHEDKPERVERVMKSVKAGDKEEKPIEEAGKATLSGKSKSSKSKSMKSKKLV